MSLRLNILGGFLMSYIFSHMKKGNNKPFLHQQRLQKHHKMSFSLTDLMTMTKMRVQDNLSFAEPEKYGKEAF